MKTFSTEPEKPALNTRCAFCQSEIGSGQQKVACADCGSRYHPECWDLNKGCAVYGCAQAPPAEKRTDLEIPPAYWGQDEKPCPACGKAIIASAVRCRYCGATFRSAHPLSEQDFNRHREEDRDTPALKRKSVLLFALCAVTCSAPIAAIVGLSWYRKHHVAVSSLPGLYRTLCLLGLSVGFGQTAVLVVAAVIHAGMRH